MREKKRVDDDWKRRAAEEKAKIASQLGGHRPPIDPLGVAEPTPGHDPAGAPATDPTAGASADSDPGPAPSDPTAGSPAPAGSSSSAAPGGPSRRETDPVFVRLISTLGGQSMLALGLTEDPHTGQRFLDLDLARETIDMLGALEARTRGNLSEEEDRLLSDVLHQLRLSYTQRVQQAQQAAMNQPPPGHEHGPGGPVPGGAGPGGPGA